MAGERHELRPHAGFVHHIVGMQAGGVDHPAAAKIAAVGAHAYNAPPVHDKVLKLGFQQQLHAVLQRIFGGGNGDSNLMLMKSDDPNLHSQITAKQPSVPNPGDSVTVDFPMFEGKYFCNERGEL